MAKTAEKHNTKKRELVEIAERLFLQKGYAETTVDDILEASGLSKGGFYHYFKSKDEVLTESLNNLVGDSLTLMEKVVEDQTLNALEKLKHFLQAKSTFEQSRRDYARYLGLLMESDFILYRYYVSLSRKFLEPFARIVEQGVNEGIFDVEHPYETADLLVRMMATGPQSALYHELLQDEIRYRKYSTSVRTALARVLGIDSRELRSQRPEVVNLSGE